MCRQATQNERESGGERGRTTLGRHSLCTASLHFVEGDSEARSTSGPGNSCGALQGPLFMLTFGYQAALEEVGRPVCV